MSKENEPKKIKINHINPEPVEIPVRITNTKESALRILLGYETDKLKPHIKDLGKPGKLKKVDIVKVYKFRITKGTKN